MAGPMGHYAYISDDGNTYRIGLNSADATACGLVAANTGPSKPTGMKPRHVLALHPTNGRERKLVVNPTSPLYVNGGQVTLTDFSTTPSAQVAFNIRGRIGEKRRSV